MLGFSVYWSWGIYMTSYTSSLSTTSPRFPRLALPSRISDGVARFIDASVRSNSENGAWTVIIFWDLFILT